MTEGTQEVEYLPFEKTPDEDISSLVPLKILTPLEQWADLFHRMANIRNQVITWEENTKIVDTKTRDEAIRLRTLVTQTAKSIDDVRQAMQKEILDYIREMNQLAKDAINPLVSPKEIAAQGVAGRLTDKINAFAVEQKRKEEEIKKALLAEKRHADDWADALIEEGRMKEARIRLEEDLKLQAIEAQALAEAQAQGQTETDQMAADIAREEAQAQIDQERADREAKLQADEAAAQKIKDDAQQKVVVGFAQATGAGKVKGVKEIWQIELIDESKLDRAFMVFDQAKAKKWLDGGFYDKKEKDAEKIIPGLRCIVVLGKGGR